jgi:DNA-binding PadR family transcriptional regulator
LHSESHLKRLAVNELIKFRFVYTTKGKQRQTKIYTITERGNDFLRSLQKKEVQA